MKLIRFVLLTLVVSSVVPAATINVTFTNTLAAPTGDPNAGPLIGIGSGTIAPLGPMTWNDSVLVNFQTGTATGTFTATFTNGTLFGSLGEQLDFTSPPTATPSVQTITVSGGTGAFLWYNGIITARGVINLVTNDPIVFSGAGTLTTTPEPGSLALVPLGFAGFYFIRRSISRRDLLNPRT